MLTGICVVATLLLGLNIFATARGLRFDGSLQHERIAQLCLIWLLPLLGSLLVVQLLRTTLERPTCADPCQLWSGDMDSSTGNACGHGGLDACGH